MFEKEAEEIANKKLCAERICYNHCNFNSPKHHRCGDWHKYYEIAKECMEYSYNKANEWHYVKDGDLPKEPKRYLCKIECYVGSAITYECSDYDVEYNSWKDSYGDVIAWKEIVLPKENE